jgi:hypothetical protein
MKERPILFSGEMVRAILEDRKTQTRRMLKKQPVDIIPARGDEEGKIWFTLRERMENIDDQRGDVIRCRYGLPGDLLWVRETWAGDDWHGYAYKATMPDALPFGEEVTFRTWKSPYHMRREASRISLEITNVRVERLKQITMSDCMAEGIEVSNSHWNWGGSKLYIDRYRNLWDSLNGKKFPWESNPWVWVIEFKRVQP